MKYILLCAFLLSVVPVSAQQKFTKPDYRAIERISKSKKEDLSPDVLMLRYLSGDSSMTLREQQQLYYGFQFTPQYSPYTHSDYSDSLNQLLEKENLDVADYIRASVFCDSVLKEDPFDLRILNAQAAFYKKTARLTKASVNIARINIVLDAILASGDGLTGNTAFYVISVKHEYAILSALDLKFGGKQSLIGSNDYLTLEENDQQIKGLYFDVTASFNSLDKLFKD